MEDGGDDEGQAWPGPGFLPVPSECFLLLRLMLIQESVWKKR